MSTQTEHDVVLHTHRDGTFSIELTTTVTPISNRGREWRQSEITEVAILDHVPFDIIRKLAEELNDQIITMAAESLRHEER